MRACMTTFNLFLRQNRAFSKTRWRIFLAKVKATISTCRVIFLERKFSQLSVFYECDFEKYIFLHIFILLFIVQFKLPCFEGEKLTTLRVGFIVYQYEEENFLNRIVKMIIMDMMIMIILINIINVIILNDHDDHFK